MFKERCCNHLDCLFNKNIEEEAPSEKGQETQSYINPKLFDILSETTPSKFYRKKYSYTSEKYSPKRKKIILGDRVKSL